MTTVKTYHALSMPCTIGATGVGVSTRFIGPPSRMLPVIRDCMYGTVSVRMPVNPRVLGNLVTVTPRLTVEVDTKIRRYTGVLKAPVSPRTRDCFFIDRDRILIADVLAFRVLKVEVADV